MGGFTFANFRFTATRSRAEKPECANVKPPIYPSNRKFHDTYPHSNAQLLMLEFMRYFVSLVLYVMSVAMTSFEFATVYRRFVCFKFNVIDQ